MVLNIELGIGAIFIAQLWRFFHEKSEKILIALGIIQVLISILQLISVLWAQ